MSDSQPEGGEARDVIHVPFPAMSGKRVPGVGHATAQELEAFAALAELMEAQGVAFGLFIALPGKRGMAAWSNVEQFGGERGIRGLEFGVAQLCAALRRSLQKPEGEEFSTNNKPEK